MRGLFHLETVSIAENQAISPTTSQRKPSGCPLYDQLRKYGLKSGDELKKQLGVDWHKKNIWDLNVDSANSFAAPIRRAYKDGTIVITPAPLEVPDWGQPEYLAFWDELIRTRVQAVHFNKNWEFSNGCTLEFAGALGADMPRFDSCGNPLEPGAGVASIEQLDKDGFDTKKLRDDLQRRR